VILADIGKFVGKKAAAAAITVAIVAAGVWCWQHPETVKALGHVVKLTIVWTAVAAALPWSSFLFMRPLLRLEAANLSTRGAGMVSIVVLGGYLLADVLLALWLAGWTIGGAFSWVVVVIGFAAAAVYNFVICESLARYVRE
jgi:hypothetical protein